MQKYRKFLVLLALSATALAVTGCGAALKTLPKKPQTPPLPACRQTEEPC